MLIYALKQHMRAFWGSYYTGLRSSALGRRGGKTARFPARPDLWLKQMQDNPKRLNIQLDAGDRKILGSAFKNTLPEFNGYLLHCLGLTDQAGMVREGSDGTAQIDGTDLGPSLTAGATFALGFKRKGKGKTSAEFVKDANLILQGAGFRSISGIRRSLIAALNEATVESSNDINEARLLSHRGGHISYVFWEMGRASPRAHYLPADRGGIMHAHQVLIGAVIQNASWAGIRPSHTEPAYSGVMADF